MIIKKTIFLTFLLLLPCKLLAEQDFVCDFERENLSLEDLKKWEEFISRHLNLYSKVLEKSMEKYKPNDYQGYAQFKVNKWNKSYPKISSMVDCLWEKYGRSLDESHQPARELTVAFSDLNIVSIQIQRYLKQGKREDLKAINERLKNNKNLINEYGKEIRQK